MTHDTATFKCPVCDKLNRVLVDEYFEATCVYCRHEEESE